jgi:hypothetical protein
MWEMSHRASSRSRQLADRHYNRQKVGTPQFVPPGRCLVLHATPPASAFWVTSWPFAEYVKHRWPGAWVCSAFRNEGVGMASEMIREAIAATRAYFGTTPDLGMVTFIDRSKVKAIMVRGTPTWGRTWRLAGFRDAGETQGGLLALQCLPVDMPPPAFAMNGQPSLLDMPPVEPP